MKEVVIPIRVQQDHLVRGYPRTNDACPIALAMKDAQVADPSVSLDEIVGVYRGASFSATTSDDVAQFIARYDSVTHFIDADDYRRELAQRGLQPFAFVIRIGDRVGDTCCTTHAEEVIL